MTALEIGFLAGLLLCVALYGFLLREFIKVHRQQAVFANQLADWQQALKDLSDSLREDERVKAVEIMLEGKAE